jgi:hypothetical protein
MMRDDDDQATVRQNLRRWRGLLVRDDLDQEDRRVLRKLLAEGEKKLAAMEAAEG